MMSDVRRQMFVLTIGACEVVPDDAMILYPELRDDCIIEEFPDLPVIEAVQFVFWIDDKMISLQRLQLSEQLHAIDAEAVADGVRMKSVSLHGTNFQHLPFLPTEPLDTPHHDILNLAGNCDLFIVLSQMISTVILLNDSLHFQELQRLHHEERVSFSLLVQRLTEGHAEV